MLDVLDKELEKRGHRFVRYADPDTCRTTARNLAASISTMQVVSWVMVTVGAAGTIAAAYCFLAGLDPDAIIQR